VSVRRDRLARACDAAREHLLAARTATGVWTGRLSASALSTATAVSALCMVSREKFDDLITEGARWLARTQNVDGGWGDTVDSPSNLATTMLARAALTLADDDLALASSVDPAETFLSRMAGDSPRRRVESLCESYGEDRTFAVPILMNCALAGHVDWKDVPPLPFELARLPRRWFSRLRLHVVSYALPALIAIGQLLHLKHPTRHPLLAAVRDASIDATLRRLAAIQPATGGFLEATPLTGFVVMSLAAAGRVDHVVAKRGVGFIERSARDDGSWPIDTNLATWVTTQAVDALAGDDALHDVDDVRRWLLAQQHTAIHPYTGSPPGAWAWTPLSGGVPDADDTAGALVALAHLGVDDTDAVVAGLRWLIDLQNTDGGWPTFCRGWGKLSFDRSAPDLTAHVLRAFVAWRRTLDTARVRRAVRGGYDFLKHTQDTDGSWTPLWFGNQHVVDHANPVYGTARVVTAYHAIGRARCEEARRGVAFLKDAQNLDGGWGGARDVPSTIEETALAVRALAPCRDDAAQTASLSGADFLAERIDEGGLAKPAPIGLYFASLWYAEGLYGAIWSVAALRTVLKAVNDEE